jgi:hypothetical protein
MKEKSLKFKEGSCYLVRFLDHTSGSDNIVEVEVIGWFLKEKEKHIVLSAWRVDDKDEEMVSNNHEPVSIVKRCIVKKKAIYIPKC